MALDSSPDFVLMTLRVLRVRCSVECPSVGICLAFFSWVSYLEEEDHRDKVPFSRQGWMLISSPCHCWRCPWCPPQALLVRVLCWAATLLTLPTLYPLERSHPAWPTHKGWGFETLLHGFDWSSFSLWLWTLRYLFCTLSLIQYCFIFLLRLLRLWPLGALSYSACPFHRLPSLVEFGGLVLFASALPYFLVLQGSPDLS